jgi:hypothetical protein
MGLNEGEIFMRRRLISTKGMIGLASRAKREGEAGLDIRMLKESDNANILLHRTFVNMAHLRGATKEKAMQDSALFGRLRQYSNLLHSFELNFDLFKIPMTNCCR